MKFTKILLWVTNLLIAGITIAFAILIFFQLRYNRVVGENEYKRFEGVQSMTMTQTISTGFYDLHYHLLYKEGESLIDDYMIWPKYLKKKVDFAKLGPEHFIQVQTSAGDITMPDVSEKVFLPVNRADVSFFYGLSIVIHVLTWLFFVSQLIWIRRLIRNFTAGAFFEKTNAKLLMRISYLYIGLPFLFLIVESFLSYRLLSGGVVLPDGHALISGVSEFQFQYLFVGLLLTLIAQALRQGFKIQEEQSLTI